MKKFIFCIVLLLNIYTFSKGFGQTVPLDSAKVLAVNFYFEKANRFFLIKNSEVHIKDFILNKSDDGIALYYIFNIIPDGFVIVSAQKNVIPVLAYSFNGKYSPDVKNPNYEYFMNIYSKQIIEAYNKVLAAGTKIKNLWNKYLLRDFSISEKGNEKSVYPLLISTWNQDIYYNEMCPTDAAGPGGHAYAGCVATAIGQIMYYHRWPKTGLGSYSYNHPVYGNISADFGNSNYDWNLMLNHLITNNLAAAKLLYHIGVSVDMDYGPNGSGMWNHKAAYSLKTYFKYCSETRYIWRDSTSLNWDSVIIANLDRKKPLYYAGWEDTTYTAGHAFVCDGYQTTDFFHFNWGWGGSYDGYFYNDQLNPGGSNFNVLQELVADIYPDTINYIYPVYCNGNEEIAGINGTLTDGSGTKSYLQLSNCSWLLNPDCGIKVKLVFDKFSLASGDTITIFDGNNILSLVLAQFDILNPPVTSDNTSPTNIESTDTNMFITFTSDNSQQADGFNASFSVEYCGTDTAYDSNGSISDGSGACDYNKLTNCRWYIMPPSAQSITLNFTEFNLATDNTSDYIKIYKNTISTGNTITTFNYANPPVAPLTIQAPVVILRFITNSETQAGGWSLDYSSSITEISETNASTDGICVFPNPFTDDAVIRFNSENTTNANIKLTDLSGKTIYQDKLCVHQNLTEVSIREIAKNIIPGYYFLKISTGKKEMIQKIICLPENISKTGY